MKVWQSILMARRELTAEKIQTAVTIGNFDGVHRGHQQIMKQTVELARKRGLMAIALTFLNHTESLLGEPPLLINMPSLRRELLAKQGLDAVLEVAFDQDLAELTPETFLKTWLLEGLRARLIVVGYDFRFGCEGRGDFQLLRDFGVTHGLEVERIAPVLEGGTVIGSSKIRQLLAEGNLELANQMLGYPFVIEGAVVTGEQLGRTMGFPTANIRLEPRYLLPCYGVYLVRMLVGTRSYFGIANVGIKPTFQGSTPLVEVYLFDVEINLYQQLVRVEFLRFIRPENRFVGLEALKQQIEKDVETAKGMLELLFR